jgi:alkylation response protein AidB-like acyl-CoA dehydrogenase
VPEEQGGAGAELADGFAVLGVAGRYALAIPLAETLLAGWLLSRAGLNAPQGAMSVAPARPGDTITLNSDGTLSGRARAVPFAREAKHLAVLAGGSVALVETAACRLSEGISLANEPQNTVTLDRVTPLARARADIDQTSLMLMGCVVRAVETAGALEAILDMSVRYANERIAFERPIAKFQAVQHNLARLAGEVSAAMTAAHSAADAIARAGTFDDAIFLEATAAKIRSAEAAQEAPRSRTRCTARSASPASTSCIAIRCACSPGATTSATRATGRSRSATGSRRAAWKNSGRWSRRADWTCR